MPGIVVGMEADEVTAEGANQEVYSVWQDSVDLTAWEGCVEEETDLDVLDGVLHLFNLFSQELWEQHQVVIVNPNGISLLDNVDDGLCELTVCLDVCFPVRFVKADLVWMVVEERPENGI